MSSGNVGRAVSDVLDESRASVERIRSWNSGIVVGRNSLFMVLAQAGGKFAGLVLFLVLVRSLTIAEIGQFTFALTFVGIFSMLTDWGISTWMMREVARRRQEASRWLGAGLCAKGFTFAGSAAIGLTVAWATRLPAGVRNVILILFAAMIADVLGQTMAYLFLALERGAISALVFALTDWLRLGFVCLALRLTPDLPHVAWAYLLATCVAPLFCSLCLRRQGLELKRAKRDDLKTALRSGIPFLLVGVFVRVYLRADTLLLGYLKTDVSVGTYNAAYKLMEALMFIPAAFMGAIFPMLSRSFGTDMPHFRAGCRMAIRVLSSLGLPLAVGTTLIAPQVIVRLYGPGYGVSVLYLRILIWASALIFMNAILPASLNACGKEKYSLAVLAVGIVLNVVGNVILIPGMDATGAAIMTVVTEVVSTLLYLLLFRRFLFAPGIPGLIWRPLLASLLMGGAAYCILDWPLLAIIVVSVGVYCTCLAAIGGVRRQDLALGLAVLGMRSQVL